MTEQISEYVEAFNIEGSRLLLEQRLVLLKELDAQVSSMNDQVAYRDYQELLGWLESYDEKAYKKTKEFKQKYQEKLAKQRKTSKAIKQYIAN